MMNAHFDYSAAVSRQQDLLARSARHRLVRLVREQTRLARREAASRNALTPDVPLPSPAGAPPTPALASALPHAPMPTPPPAQVRAAAPVCRPAAS